MSVRAGSGLPADSVSWVAVALVVLLGWATVLALGSAAAGSTELAAWVGAGVAAGTVVLLAGGWSLTHPLVLVALTLPLPALYSTDRLRVAPPLLLTAVVVAAWALRYAPRPRRVDLRALPVRSAAFWLGAVAVSTLFAGHLLPAVRELTSLALLLALLAVATHELTVRPSGRHVLATALACVAGGAGAAATLQAVGAVPTPFPLPGTDFGRATIGFEWPNEAGMFLAILLPFSVRALVGARGPGRRVLAGVGVAATVTGLLATFSRGSWTAAAVAPAALLLVGGWRFAARVWVGAAVAILAVELASGGAVSTRVAMTLDDPLVGQRASLMLTGLIMFGDHPLVGLGPGGFAANLERYGTQVSSLWDYVGSAHNTYIQMAAETGVLGLSALLLFLGVVFRALVVSAREERRRRGQRLPEGRPAFRLGLAEVTLWSFATVCLVSMIEWSLTQGVGQLAMLTIALGLTGGAAAGARHGATAESRHDAVAGAVSAAEGSPP